MNKSAATTKQPLSESAWGARMARFASSGQTVGAFCRDEGISAYRFYQWRKLLGIANRQTRPQAKRSPTSFIDLGSMPAPQASGAPTQGGLDAAAAGIEIRIDLGGGMALTIARR
jgi:hypothetical protein